MEQLGLGVLKDMKENNRPIVYYSLPINQARPKLFEGSSRRGLS